MTRGAREFVAPLTFASLSKHEVLTEVWGSGRRPRSSTSRPPPRATSSSSRPRRPTRSAKLANGLADDFLSTCVPRATAAPSCSRRRWSRPCGSHAAVRANVERLASARGAVARRPGERSPRLGTRGRRPNGRARDDRRGGLAPGDRSSGADLDGTAASRHGRARRGSRSTRSGSSRTARAAEWGSRWPRRRATGARASRSLAGPTGLAGSGRRARPRRSRPRTISTACSFASFRSATASSWPRPSATSSRRRARDACTARDGAASASDSRPGRDILASLAASEAGPDRRGLRCRDGGPRRARGRRKMESEGRRSRSSSTTWAETGIGFDADDNEVLILRPRRLRRAVVTPQASARSPTGSGTRFSPCAAFAPPTPRPPRSLDSAGPSALDSRTWPTARRGINSSSSATSASRDVFLDRARRRRRAS